ncbi:MAG: 5-(carboxyamino)imidazole ribonucleotide synthase [Candidatus Aramenus sulfurataquae]|uniref:N5-carboxyaminoimidazole ribonucleotide synthase n=2 Tax=Candidatus Aramenus sulfurataquae TaxID=1326980 RepID=A0A0F2LLB1_9CREN|nr:5-(carboxyamino)imidazole ribonucleotide synthase [Candidatus Aramenus sulfurataquae]
MKSSLPSYKVCILGGGQLGWMMILEGRKLPLTFYVIANPEEPACRVADKCFSEENYKEAINQCDVVTFEFEHVNEEALEYAQESGKLLPKVNSVELKRERYKEKEFLRDHGFPVPRFKVVQDGEEALKVLKDEFNNVGVLKQSRGGYDGKGQYFVKGDPEKYQFLKNVKCKFVVEEFVNFDFEASIIATRGRGEFKAYTPSFNYNEKGILIYNYGPYYNEEMVKIAERLTKELDYIGTMGIEFFVVRNKVLINELAPRVHNTGHYTLDGAFTSQFEQHLRAILGMELGETTVLKPFGMVNIVGRPSFPPEVLKLGKVYWYGKEEARKRRKMGHVNVVGEDLEEVKQKIDKIMQLIYPEGLDL